MISTIVMGFMVFGINFMSDRFGRRTMYLIGITARPILGIAEVFMPNFFAKCALGILKRIACAVGDIIILQLYLQLNITFRPSRISINDNLFQL